MYLPSHFAQPDPAAIAQLLQSHPLATLVWTSAQGLTAEHVPLMLDRGADDGEHGTLRGHVARANPLWRESAGAAVLAVFQGAQAYVSPSAYPSKANNPKVVPTWNYAVVHAHGALRAVEDAVWLRALVGRLTDTHEAGRAQRWQVGDAPADYVAQMLAAVVGIEIPLTRLVGKWKHSQNRTAADRDGVIDALRGDARDGPALASAMQATLRGPP